MDDDATELLFFRATFPHFKWAEQTLPEQKV